MSTNLDAGYMLDVLVRLLNTPSPTGDTKRAISLVEDELLSMGLKPRRNNKGALLVTLEGSDESKARTLSGHVDTLGAMVKHIKPNGRLKFTTIGGYTMNSVEGEYCSISTGGGKTYTGTVLSVKPSVHVHRDSGKLERTPENMEIRLDEKTFSAEETRALGIEVGDFVYWDPRVCVTDSGYVKSRHLDDKAAVAIMLAVAKYFAKGFRPACTSHLFFSNYEEVGHGASVGIPHDTEELIAVDMGAMGEEQATDEHTVSICAKDSSGPYDLDLRRKLVSIAKAEDIGYKVDVYPYYGSDASAALRAGLNARCIVVGPGVHASHANERTHRESLEATARLLIAYLSKP